MTDDLPIDDVLPELLAALSQSGLAVLQAPPGAGKTTRVPLAMLKARLVAGRIVMLEPRRIAARAAADRMAATLGEAVGQTVGYRIRGEAKVSATTRIEVVTEGILTRMLQSDPSLAGVGALIFDEFHERSLNADLGLALAWEVRCALRPDLMLLVMSATLDAAPVAALLGAPVVTSYGRAFPVDTRWLDRPVPRVVKPERAMADLILLAVAESDSGILAFLPGEGEIRRVGALVEPYLPPDMVLRPLYGAMALEDQRRAVAPEAARKLVLATSIAETSLTIAGISVVVDMGRARRARFDASSGMARLVTERATRAEVDQRRGRAGRVEPGTCYRLWTRGEDGAMAAFAPPEIEVADLAPLALELALWGDGNGAGLAFLTPPNPAALAEAQALLRMLGALDSDGRITAAGKKLAALPLHPRLGRMLLAAGPAAAPLAALLSDRDPVRAASSDLTLRLEALADPGRFAASHPYDIDRAALRRIADEGKRLTRLAPGAPANLTPAEQAALAYPDRIARRRPGDAPRFLLANGKGAYFDLGDPLANLPMNVATDLDGDPREARVRLALALPEVSLRRLFGAEIQWRNLCHWSRREGRVLTRQQECFGALVLADRPWHDAPAEALAQGALEAVRDLGLNALGWTDAAQRFRARVRLLAAQGCDLPDMSDDGLLAGLEAWLLPTLGPCRTAADLRANDPLPALQAWLTHSQRQLLDRLAPQSFETPLGRQVPIDYSGQWPAVELRLQELFGLTQHPVVGPDRTPLRLTLLSPGGKPVQVTLDLPGFWARSYADVRRDMRGRYPRHPWPDDPTEAAPTLRAKPRGT